MLTTKRFSKTLLTTSLAAILSVGALNACAQDAQEPKVYVDPVTGEVKDAPKMLSEMTDEEKALLSNEEYKALKELEDKINAEAAGQTENPGG